MAVVCGPGDVCVAMGGVNKWCDAMLSPHSQQILTSLSGGLLTQPVTPNISAANRENCGVGTVKAGLEILPEARGQTLVPKC